LTALRCCMAVLGNAAALAGLAGSDGDTGCDRGDGACRLLGSGALEELPPATDA
jgi:hypothetical protein